jgi:hypothetical protein
MVFFIVTAVRTSNLSVVKICALSEIIIIGSDGQRLDTNVLKADCYKMDEYPEPGCSGTSNMRKHDRWVKKFPF